MSALKEMILSDVYVRADSQHEIKTSATTADDKQREEIEVETLDVDSGSDPEEDADEVDEDEVLEDEELLEDEYSGEEKLYAALHPWWQMTGLKYCFRDGIGDIFVNLYY